MPGGRPASSKCGAKIGKGTCGVAILRGDVSRITYRDEATHYTVAKLEVDMPSGEGTSRAVEVTIVGRFPSLVPGEWLEVEGEWYVHSEFGRQFRVTGFRKAPPVTAKGIERYLASGAAKGIGPKLAQRLVAKFGERTLEVIEKEPHRLLEVEGIGAQKKKAIAKALQEEREAREALVFLQSYGITPGIANKIYRRYGPDTIATVRENPYAWPTRSLASVLRRRTPSPKRWASVPTRPSGPRLRWCTFWARREPRGTCTCQRSG